MKNTEIGKSNTTNTVKEIAGILAVGYLRMLAARRTRNGQVQEHSDDSQNE